MSSEEEENYIKIELPRLNYKLYKLDALPKELINVLSLEELNQDVIRKFMYLNRKRIRRIHKFLLLFFFLAVLNILFGIILKENNFKLWFIILIIITSFQVLTLPSFFFINRDHFKETMNVINYLNEIYSNRSIKFEYVKKYGFKHYKNGNYYIYIYDKDYFIPINTNISNPPPPLIIHSLNNNENFNSINDDDFLSNEKSSLL